MRLWLHPIFIHKKRKIIFMGLMEWVFMPLQSLLFKSTQSKQNKLLDHFQWKLVFPKLSFGRTEIKANTGKLELYFAACLLISEARLVTLWISLSVFTHSSSLHLRRPSWFPLNSLGPWDLRNEVHSSSSQIWTPQKQQELLCPSIFLDRVAERENKVIQ